MPASVVLRWGNTGDEAWLPLLSRRRAPIVDKVPAVAAAASRRREVLSLQHSLHLRRAGGNYIQLPIAECRGHDHRPDSRPRLRAPVPALQLRGRPCRP